MLVKEGGGGTDLKSLIGGSFASWYCYLPWRICSKYFKIYISEPVTRLDGNDASRTTKQYDNFKEWLFHKLCIKEKCVTTSEQ